MRQGRKAGGMATPCTASNVGRKVVSTVGKVRLHALSNGCNPKMWNRDAQVSPLPECVLPLVREGTQHVVGAYEQCHCRWHRDTLSKSVEALV